MVSSTEKTGAAMLLEPAGVQTLAARRAMRYVIAPLLKNQKSVGAAYGVLVYGRDEQKPQPNVLIAVDAFLRAYKKVLNVLRNSDASAFDDAAKNRQKIEIEQFGDVQFYLGQASENVLKQRVDLSPGVYIMTGLLDENVLESLNLPLLPEPFRKLQMVAQVRDVAEPQRELIEVPLEEVPAESSDSKIDPELLEHTNRDSLDWRKEFLRSIPCWNSAQVAEQAASTASNKAALASRWLNERKIFAVKAGAQAFPQFQFQYGYPIPAVARVIEQFPEHATGWDLAYFFSAPNSFIDGRRPYELLRSEPDRVVSLAKTFVHPSDAF